MTTEAVSSRSPMPEVRRVRRGLRAWLLGACAAAWALAVFPTETRPQPAAADRGSLQWFKGNTHAHTLNSDGDSTPDDVVRWYREHGYNFVVLTDHNFLTGVDGLNALHGAGGKFLVIKGEEVSDAFDGKSIHVNGLDVARLVKPQGGRSTADVIQRNVDAIRAEGGVPHINHPNFQWAITAEDLRQVERTRLFEVYSGHPLVNNLGGGGAPGLEEVWDRLLTSGRLLYGIAVDDAHHFKDPYAPLASAPGRAWVTVRAPELSAPAVLEALERGEFYASTGVQLADYQADGKSVRIDIKEDQWSRYRVQFFGAGGRVLAEVGTDPAVYEIRGDEQYVRAKVIESNGRVAWTQPVMVQKP